MKHFAAKPIAFILTLALLCAALLPVYAQETTKPYVKIFGNYYTEGLLSLRVDYHALGSAEYVDFSIKYNAAALKLNFWCATCDFIFETDESNAGEIIFHAKPSSPHADGGSFNISFWVLNDQGFDLEFISGEYVDLNGKKGTTDIRERIIKNHIPEEQLVGLPEDFIASHLCCGDVDFDLNVTAQDARIILRATVELEDLSAAQNLCADMDGDGEITASDARLALRDAVGL